MAAVPGLQVPEGQGDSSAEPGAGAKKFGSVGIHDVEPLPILTISTLEA